MNEATMEIRYQEYDGDWTLTDYQIDKNGEVYATTKTLDTTGGKVGKYPAWLKKIVDVARVGGHLKQMDQGPPDAILWFKVDKDFNLLEITFP
jgi:hypothetical protein